MTGSQSQPSLAGKVARRLYYESGIQSLYTTGCDAGLVICSRTCRMFAFGAVSLTLASFLSELNFSDLQIGLFMSLTLVGDVVLGLVVTLMADGLGRRRVLFTGGLLMGLSGIIFSYFENFWVLLLAAVVGIVSASGGDFGPFRAIEESVLSHITTPRSRTDVLSWYVTSSSLGSAVGMELAGRFVEALTTGKEIPKLRVYHMTFWIYTVMGALNMFCAMLMSQRCEIETASTEYSDELAQGLLEDVGHDHVSLDILDNQGHAAPAPAPPKGKSRISQISSATRSAMYKLWFLLTVDCLADGMVSHSLTSYYLDRKFELPKASLGHIMSASLTLGTISTIFAGPLARHIGLLNTMVFTHLPSSVAVFCFPIPSGLVMTVILLFIRLGLNNMDQAPRAAFIAAVVKPDERTAVMGITSTLRTMAMAVGPFVTGALADTNKFWIAYILAGSLRILYDFGLWAMFLNVKLHTHEKDVQDDGHQNSSSSRESWRSETSSETREGLN